MHSTTESLSKAKNIINIEWKNTVDVRKASSLSVEGLPNSGYWGKSPHSHLDMLTHCHGYQMTLHNCGMLWTGRHTNCIKFLILASQLVQVSHIHSHTILRPGHHAPPVLKQTTPESVWKWMEASDSAETSWNEPENTRVYLDWTKELRYKTRSPQYTYNVTE